MRCNTGRCARRCESKILTPLGDADPNRRDFKLVIGAGYRPGYTRVSELENVVSIAVKVRATDPLAVLILCAQVNSLGIPLRALQAWDANLITGEVKYLVLLCFFGARYPLDMDYPTKSDVRFAVGVSPKYKPSRAAVAAASRSLTGSPVWTSTSSLLPGISC